MKKLILASLLTLMISCEENNDNTSLLIKKDMEKTLVNPDSYKAIETQTDSAYAPQDAPELFNKLIEYAKDTMAIESIDNSISELEKEKTNTGTAIGVYKMKNITGNDYDRLTIYYEACDVQIGILKFKQDSISNTLGKKVSEIKALLASPRKFIGFKAKHLYKAKNKDNKSMTDSCYYLLDKDMSHILYSMPLETYNVIKEMRTSIE